MLLVPRRKNAGQNRRSSTLFSFLSSLLTVTNWSPLAPAEFLPRRRVVRELLQGLATEESALTTAVNDQCGGFSSAISTQRNTWTENSLLTILSSI